MSEFTRKKTEMSNRRNQVSERYLRGMYMVDIAAELGVDVATVSRDLSAMRQVWLGQSVANIDQKKAIELAKVDRLEVTYWEAWERSCQDAETEITEQIGVRSKEKTKSGKPQEIIISPERIKKIRRVEGQSGNPAFLAGVLDCIKRRCEILGLDAPKKAEHSGKVDLDLIEMTVDEWKAQQAKRKSEVSQDLAAFDEKVEGEDAA